MDDTVPQGARRFAFRGDGPAVVKISSEAPLDLSPESKGDGMSLVRLRRDADAPRDATIAVACGGGCSGKLPLAETLSALPAGKCPVVGEPLECFQKTGADLTKVNALLVAQLVRQAGFQSSQVDLRRVADGVVACK